MIHSDLQYAKSFIYDKCGFGCTEPKAEEESAEYGAYFFRINAKAVRFRVAKITPTKIGQFVTLWKRIPSGTIAPFDLSDDIDLVVINTTDDKHSGQFVFPRAVLLEHAILSGKNKKGKRGFRVYPPWCKLLNKQATKTQQWQQQYFLSFPIETPADLSNAKTLFQ